MARMHVIVLAACLCQLLGAIRSDQSLSVFRDNTAAVASGVDRAERFCSTLPPEGAWYFEKHNPADGFLFNVRCTRDPRSRHLYLHFIFWAEGQKYEQGGALLKPKSEYRVGAYHIPFSKNNVTNFGTSVKIDLSNFRIRWLDTNEDQEGCLWQCSKDSPSRSFCGRFNGEIARLAKTASTINEGVAAIRAQQDRVDNSIAVNIQDMKGTIFTNGQVDKFHVRMSVSYWKRVNRYGIPSVEFRSRPYENDKVSFDVHNPKDRVQAARVARLQPVVDNTLRS